MKEQISTQRDKTMKICVFFTNKLQAKILLKTCSQHSQFYKILCMINVIPYFSTCLDLWLTFCCIAAHHQCKHNPMTNYDDNNVCVTVSGSLISAQVVVLMPLLVQKSRHTQRPIISSKDYVKQFRDFGFFFPRHT